MKCFLQSNKDGPVRPHGEMIRYSRKVLSVSLLVSFAITDQAALSFRRNKATLAAFELLKLF